MTADRKRNVVELSRQLRLQVCKKLGLDADKLSPGDSVLVGHAGTLEMLLTDMDADVVNGRPISVAIYNEAAETLQKIYRIERRSAEGGTRGLDEARKQLADALGIVLGDDNPDAVEHRKLREHIEQLEAENVSLHARLNAQPAQADPQREQAETHGLTPEETEDCKRRGWVPSEYKARLRVVLAPTNSRPNSPWRNHLSASGEIITGRGGECVVGGSGGLSNSELNKGSIR